MQEVRWSKALSKVLIQNLEKVPRDNCKIGLYAGLLLKVGPILVLCPGKLLNKIGICYYGFTKVKLFE